jgi:hypothetical protein
MGTFDLPIKAVTAETLEQLKEQAVKEGLQLEYKEFLPTDKTQNKFLTSITAFANTSGGDLIYGIRAKRDDENVPTGEPEAIVGLPGVNIDQQKLRLEQWIRAHIEPPLVAIIEPIERGSEPPCLLVRVLASWATIHMVKTMANPFYGRNSANKYPLSFDQIRQGFTIAGTLRDRVGQFRDDRIQRILRGEAPAQIGSGPKLIFHALPLNPAHDAWARFREAEHLAEKQKQPSIALRLTLIYGRQNTWHYNTDGFLVSTLQTGGDSYVQVFRDCGIEALDISVQFSGWPNRDDSLKVYHGINIERGVIRAFKSYQQFWNWLGIPGPMTVYLTLLGGKGGSLVSLGLHPREFIPIDRDCLMTPDVVVDDLSAPADTVLKPLFDFLWNASGYPESPHYENGTWKEPK